MDRFLTQAPHQSIEELRACVRSWPKSINSSIHPLYCAGKALDRGHRPQRAYGPANTPPSPGQATVGKHKTKTQVLTKPQPAIHFHHAVDLLLFRCPPDSAPKARSRPNAVLSTRRADMLGCVFLMIASLYYICVSPVHHTKTGGRRRRMAHGLPSPSPHPPAPASYCFVFPVDVPIKTHHYRLSPARPRTTRRATPARVQAPSTALPPATAPYSCSCSCSCCTCHCFMP